MSKVRFLALQIRMGNITIEQVPKKYYDDVLKNLRNEHSINEVGDKR